MGRPLFPITSGNSWIIQWAPVDYVVSKTLGLPLGKEDKRQGGIKTCLKVKEFNRSGSYSFREVSEAERKSSISAGLLAKETCTTWRSGDVQISCKAPNTGTALLLPYQSKGNAPSAPMSRIQGSRLSETHHVFGNKHRLYPRTSPSLTELSEEFLLQSSWEKSHFQIILQSLLTAVLFFCQPKAEWLKLDRKNKNEASLSVRQIPNHQANKVTFLWTRHFSRITSSRI